MTSRLPDGLDRDYRMRIGDRWVAASDGATFPCVDPFTATNWGQVPVATADDVNDAVAAAPTAFPSWAARPPASRARLLRKLGDLLEGAVDELARIQVHENGKLLTEMRLNTQVLAGNAHHFAGLASALHGDTVTTSLRGMATFTLREPLGVVAAITPWNTPRTARQEAVPIGIVLTCLAAAVGGQVGPQAASPCERATAADIGTARLEALDGEALLRQAAEIHAHALGLLGSLETGPAAGTVRPADVVRALREVRGSLETLGRFFVGRAVESSRPEIDAGIMKLLQERDSFVMDAREPSHWDQYRCEPPRPEWPDGVRGRGSPSPADLLTPPPTSGYLYGIDL